MSKDIYSVNSPKLIIFLSVLVAFSPAYLFTYAFNDDYALLGQVIAGFCDTLKWDVLSGRPLFAVLRLMAYKSSITLDELSYLRAISALCATGMALNLYYFLRKNSILDSDIKRIFLSIALCVTPTFQVYTAWATCCVYIMATWLTLIAYQVSNSDRIALAPRILITLVLITASFAIYQPAGMAFLSFAFMDICLSDKTISYKKVFRSIGYITLGVLSSAAMTKLIPDLVYGESFERASITHDVLGKIIWFLNGPLSMVISNYDITLSKWYFIASLIVFIIGILFILKGKEGYQKLLLTLIFALGSFSLSLIVNESWATWRTMPGLSIITTSVLALVFFSINSKLFKSSKSVTVTVLTLMILSCSYNITRGFVIPQRSELQSLAAELSNKVNKEYKGKIMIDISNPTYNAFSWVQKTDEFGNISLATEWAPWGMALYLKKVKHFSFEIPYKPTITTPEQCKEDCIIIKTSNAMLNSTTNF